MIMKNITKRILAYVLTLLLVISLLPIPVVYAATKYEYYDNEDTATWAYGSDDVAAQTFTAESNHTITSVKLKLYKTGNPGTATFFLTSTIGGHPNSYGILRTGSTDADTLTVNTAGEWREITFSSYTLVSGIKYAIVIKAPDGDINNRLYFRYDSTSPTYSGGNLEYSLDGGADWTSYTASDIAFEIWGAAVIVRPTVTTQAVSAVGSTTATGNGNITVTGGENATKRGVVYDINSYGNPGNVSPVVSSYDYYEEELGSFGTGAFTASLTGLDLGKTYYVRAYAYNSEGYSYGVEVNFTTDLTAPTITINAASNVAKTSARLNSLLNDDGGENCDIRFGYGTVSEAAIDFLDYETVTDWVNTYSTGSHPYLDIASLVADTEYFFRVQAKNSEDTTTSTDEESFTTEAAIAVCTNFKALPKATSVSLSWVKGTGASQTLVRYSFETYPADEAEGTQLYLGTGSSTIHANLEPGTTIYYTAWGESDEAYSAGVDLLTTTLAGSITGVDVDTPIMPSNWFLDTDYTTMSNFEPLFTTINDSADAIDMPRSTAWYLSAIVFCVLASYGTYQIGHQQLVPAGVVMVISIGLMSAVQLVPMYMLFLIIIVVIGVGISRRSM